MKKQEKIRHVSVSEAHRRMLREARERLGFTQAALDKKARMGKTYTWYVETGKTRSTAPDSLLRLVTTLQRQAERADVPARLKVGLQRLLHDVEKQGKGKS